jgi:hypothetical protein
VARTKHLAKIASQVAKPDGLVVVDPDSELEFLHHLPVELMWGVGPVTRARLAEIGVHTIGQLAKTPELVARAVARSRDGGETRSAGVESRSTGNQDSPTGRICRSAVRRSAGSLLKSEFSAPLCFILQTESAPASGPNPDLVEP